ncbi:MAG: hypothetical protein ACREJT_13180, partial [Myxococcota bacterium]
MSPDHDRLDQHPNHRFPLLGRRDILRAGAAIGLAAGAMLPARALRAAQPPAPPAPSSRSSRPRNVIFMVADGMSTGTLTLADMMIRHTAGGPAWA